jgi:hypothetical protein
MTHPLVTVRVNWAFYCMSLVDASIYCSPHHRLRSRLTRQPATGICLYDSRARGIFHGSKSFNEFVFALGLSV